MASLLANDRLVLRLANMVMVEVLGIDRYMSLLVQRSLTPLMGLMHSLYTKWGQAILCVHVYATGCVYTMVSVCV